MTDPQRSLSHICALLVILMVGCNGETALIVEPFPGSVSPGRDLDYRVDLSTIITANETHNRSGRWDNIVCWGAAGGKLNRALLGVLVSGYSIALSLRGPTPPSAITLSLSLFPPSLLRHARAHALYSIFTSAINVPLVALSETYDKFTLASSVIKLYTQKSSIRLFMSCIQELLVLQSFSLVSLMIFVL